MRQLTAAEIETIKNDQGVYDTLLDWANAICKRHTDHVGDAQADVWGAVCNALNLNTDTEGDIDTTPALIHVKYNDAYVDGVDSGRNNTQCYAITEALVWLKIDDNPIIEIEVSLDTSQPEPVKDTIVATAEYLRESNYTHVQLKDGQVIAL